MMMTFYRALLPLLLGAAAAPAPDSPPRALSPSYADLVDLSLAAPVVAHVRTAEAIRVKDAQAAGLRPGLARLYVEADIVSLIRAASPLGARIRYVVDLPKDTRGRPPKIRKGTEFLILAAPVPGRAAEVRLAAPDAQIAYSAAEAQRLRAIARELAAADPAPRITGVGKAFHVPGSLPGESETQIFLQTADGRPVSLNILRRPGETPRWTVALSEIVDEAAGTPARDTLLWYRLACALPPGLPPPSVAEADPAARAAIAADYRLVLESLASCGRTRGTG